MINIEKKWFKAPNLLYGLLTKYHGSLNNPSRANGDSREQIFARDCNNSGETEEVIENQGLVGNWWKREIASYTIKFL